MEVVNQHRPGEPRIDHTYRQRTITFIFTMLGLISSSLYKNHQSQMANHQNFLNANELIVKRSSLPSSSMNYYLLLATSLTSNTVLLLILVATIVRSTNVASSMNGDSPNNSRSHYRPDLPNHAALIMMTNKYQQIPKVKGHINHQHISLGDKTSIVGNSNQNSNKNERYMSPDDILQQMKLEQKFIHKKSLRSYSQKLIDLPQILSQQLAKLWLARVGRDLGRNATPENAWSLLARLNSTLTMMKYHYQHQNNNTPKMTHRWFQPIALKSTNDAEEKSIQTMSDKINSTNHILEEGLTQNSNQRSLKMTEVQRANLNPNQSTKNVSLNTATCDYNERNNRAINLSNQQDEHSNQNQKEEQDNQQQEQQPQQQSFQPQNGEARQKRRLLKRIMKKADWNALLIEVSKVFLRYFLDLVLNDMLGKSGSSRKQHLDPQSNVTDMLRDFLRAAAGL